MLQIKPLSAELQKVAIEELGEVPARIPEDLQALKDWIKKQPHLRARTDDQFLIQFLRGCKYSLEKAKEKIDHFFALKTKCPDIFSITDIDDPHFRNFHNVGSYIILPKPLHEFGPRIILNSYKDGLADFTMSEVIKYGVAVSEVLLTSDPFSCIYGTMYVFDFEKTPTPFVMQVTPNLVKQLITFYEKTLPVRIKGVCLINLSPTVEKILRALVQYAPEKLKTRVSSLH